MRFLLDTNILSAFLKGDGKVFGRFMQYSGGLATSTICVGELYSWACRAKNRNRLEPLEALLRDLHIIPVDLDIAAHFGSLRADLLDRGRPVPGMDLLIAATASFHDLTLVTHNVDDFAAIESIRTEDWLA
jgi:tRNA(fMet)-specific endonuclease VapC